MIVNLADATLDVIKNAELNVSSISHVAFYNSDEEEMQVCTFQDFIEVAADINYDELDPVLSSRRVIDNSIQIVGDTWWLRRTNDSDDNEGWIYSDLPIPLTELENGEGDLHQDYIINPIDSHDEDYVELVEHESDNYKYARSDTIKLFGKTFDVIDDNGIFKVVDGEYVFVVIAANENDTYFTTNDTTLTHVDLIFEPKILKLAESNQTSDIELSDELMRKLTGISNTGFGKSHKTSIKISKVRRGVKFTINTVDGFEHIEYLDNIQWVNG